MVPLDRFLGYVDELFRVGTSKVRGSVMGVWPCRKNQHRTVDVHQRYGATTKELFVLWIEISSSTFGDGNEHPSHLAQRLVQIIPAALSHRIQHAKSFYPCP